MNQGFKIISGSFFDGVAVDIPSNNWTREIWRLQLEEMMRTGMDTGIMIRVGWNDSAMYDSPVMRTTLHEEDDLVEFLLTEADRIGMKMYVGLFDTYKYWPLNDWENEVAINERLIEELWERYGHHRSFYGWYISHEGDMKYHQHMIWRPLMLKAKSLDASKKILISPRYAGPKYHNPKMTPELHVKHFRYIFDQVGELVDAAAFMDGHVDFRDLPDYLETTSKLCAEYNISFWSNLETFDRDMPWRFPPLEWSKMRFKLEAAQPWAEKIITFEAPHFLSPYSMFPSAHGLYHRYLEYLADKHRITFKEGEVPCLKNTEFSH